MTPIEKMRAVLAERKAKKLAAIEKRKATIAAKKIGYVPDPAWCRHAYACKEWHSENCCACADKRPNDPAGYIAYMHSNLSDTSLVPRSYYYCSGCKNRLKIEESTWKYVEDAPFKQFGMTYYDGLREAYNVAGAEMLEYFEIFKELGCDHNKFVEYLIQNDDCDEIKNIIKAYCL